MFISMLSLRLIIIYVLFMTYSLVSLEATDNNKKVNTKETILIIDWNDSHRYHGLISLLQNLPKKLSDYSSLQLTVDQNEISFQKPLSKTIQSSISKIYVPILPQHSLFATYQQQKNVMIFFKKHYAISSDKIVFFMVEPNRMEILLFKIIHSKYNTNFLSSMKDLVNQLISQPNEYIPSNIQVDKTMEKTYPGYYSKGIQCFSNDQKIRIIPHIKRDVKSTTIKLLIRSRYTFQPKDITIPCLLKMVPIGSSKYKDMKVIIYDVNIPGQKLIIEPSAINLPPRTTPSKLDDIQLKITSQINLSPIELRITPNQIYKTLPLIFSGSKKWEWLPEQEHFILKTNQPYSLKQESLIIPLVFLPLAKKDFQGTLDIVYQKIVISSIPIHLLASSYIGMFIFTIKQYGILVLIGFLFVVIGIAIYILIRQNKVQLNKQRKQGYANNYSCLLANPSKTFFTAKQNPFNSYLPELKKGFTVELYGRILRIRNNQNKSITEFNLEETLGKAEYKFLPQLNVLMIEEKFSNETKVHSVITVKLQRNLNH